MLLNDSMGSIILVEDHDGARTVMYKLLTSKGYRVEEYASAEAAIERMDRGNSIALVVIDVQLQPGGMNGIELAEWVGTAHPGVPVMFVTGDVTQITKPGFIVLPKPVKNEEFLAYVWQHVKMGLLSAGFRELKQDFAMCIEKMSEVGDDVKSINGKLTLHMQENARIRTTQDETIMKVSARIESAHREAIAAGNKADNASTNATNAHVKVDNVTLGTAAKNWKDKLDPFSLTVMTALTAVLLWFASSYKDDLFEKATGIDAKIKKEIAVVQVDIKKTCDKVETIDRSLMRQDMKINELDRGQGGLDRKLDRLLYHFNVAPPAMSSPAPGPTPRSSP